MPDVADSIAVLSLPVAIGFKTLVFLLLVTRMMRQDAATKLGTAITVFFASLAFASTMLTIEHIALSREFHDEDLTPGWYALIFFTDLAVTLTGIAGYGVMKTETETRKEYVGDEPLDDCD